MSGPISILVRLAEIFTICVMLTIGSLVARPARAQGRNRGWWERKVSEILCQLPWTGRERERGDGGVNGIQTR